MVGNDHALPVAAIILLFAAVNVLAEPVVQSTAPLSQSLALRQAADLAWLNSLDSEPRSAAPAAQLSPSAFEMIHQSDQITIPLPAADWTGIFCLVGLALFRGRKKIRKLFT